MQLTQFALQYSGQYKMEAASDARLMYDMLTKMLQYPVFLDSAKLTDLRQLITHGVADCDVMVVLGTKGYITRPWCLLEIVHATRLKTPIVVLDVKNGNFDVDESLSYIDCIEEKMGADDPASLELLREHLGPDLTELKQACTAVLTSTQVASKQLVWNPNASDSELIACLKDLIDAMATVTGSTLKWAPSRSGPDKDTSLRRSSSFSSFRSKARPSKVGASPALHLVCNCDEAMTDARVLQVVLPFSIHQHAPCYPAPCSSQPAARNPTRRN